MKFVDRKKMPLNTEIILHFYFPFKAFPENARERERERACVRGEAINGAISHRIEIAIDGERGRSEIAPSINDDKSSPTTAPLITIRDRDRRRDLAKRRSRSRIAVVGLELARSARTGARSSPVIVGLTGMFLLLSRARARALSLSFSGNTLKGK